MGIVKAVCTSDRRGIQKTNVGSAELKEDFGILTDAHAGNWHRQVSLLSAEKIEEFNRKGAEVTPEPLVKIWWWKDLILAVSQWERLSSAERWFWR